MGGRDTPKERHHSARDCPHGPGAFQEGTLRKDLHPPFFFPSTHAIFRDLNFPTSVAISKERWDFQGTVSILGNTHSSAEILGLPWAVLRASIMCGI